MRPGALRGVPGGVLAPSATALDDFVSCRGFLEQVCEEFGRLGPRKYARAHARKFVTVLDICLGD